MQFNIFFASLLFTCSAVFAATDYDALKKNATASFLNVFKNSVHKQAQLAVNSLANICPPEARDDVKAFLNKSISAFESQIITDVTPVASNDIANAVKALEVQQKPGFGPLEYAQLGIKLTQDVSPVIDQDISKWVSDNTDKLIEVVRTKTGSAVDDLIKKLEDFKKKVETEHKQVSASTNSVKLQRRSFVAAAAAVALVLKGIFKLFFGYIALNIGSIIVGATIMFMMGV